MKGIIFEKKNHVILLQEIYFLKNTEKGLFDQKKEKAAIKEKIKLI